MFVDLSQARALRTAGLLALLLAPRDGFASCDIIPGTLQSFRGTNGAVDRPFASPGDWLKVMRDPRCPAEFPGFFARPTEQVVTVVFKPPAAPRNVVILATDCASVENARQTCEARADVAS